MSGTLNPAGDEILRHVNWIRRVAYAILRDHELAQDVSQDVLVRALEGEPRQGKVLRGWLAAVTRNRALDLLRERRRRSERELLAARSDATPPTRDPVEALEAHRALAAAIQALPPEAKAIVLLRFYEDLDFPAIAARLGVTENAARVRLHRALGHLRAQLGRAGTEWKTLCLQALPAGGALLSASAPLTKILAMKVIPTVALGALGLLLLLLAYFQFRPATNQTADLEPAAHAAASAARPSTAPTAEPGAEPPPLERVEFAGSEAEAGDWVLGGQVEIPGGLSAAGVRVQAKLREGYDAECPILHEALLTASSDGRFTWSLPTPVTAVFVSVGPEEGVRGWGDSRLVLAGAPPPQDLGVTVIRYGTPVRGVVRNEAREPLAGATVLGGEAPVTTDAEGCYELKAPLGWDSVSVYARAAEYEQQQQDVRLPTGRDQSVDFVLSSEFVVRGRVLDEQGAPVEGAVVMAFDSHRNTVTTGADGAYELRHLSPRAGSHQLYARKAGYCEAVARVSVESRTMAEQDLLMRRGARVSGRVTGPDGAPLEGAKLYVGFSPYAYNRLDAVAHAGGEFEFPHVPPGQQTLVARAVGMPEARVLLQIAEDQAELSGLQIVLERGHFAAGVVQDEEGTPLAGVWIEPMRGYDSAGPRLQSDAEGRFRIEGLPAQGSTLSLYKEGFVRTNLEISDLDRTDHVLRMEHCGALAGRVLDGVTGQPLESFTIRLGQPFESQPGDRSSSGFDASWVDPGVPFTEAGGAWTSGEILEVGTVLSVAASAPGYGSARVDRVLVKRDPDPEALVLRLLPGAVLRGRIVSGTGAPLARASVRFLGADALDEGRIPDEGSLPTSITGEDGGFLLTDLPPGPAQLLVAHAEWMPSIEGPFTLAPGEANDPITIRMQAGSTLRGVVRSADGTPLAGAIVTTYGPSGPNLDNRMRETKADADGRFTLAHLCPGEWQILAGRPRGTSQVDVLSVRLLIEAGQDREIVLQPRGSGTVRGRVEFDGVLPELQNPLQVTLHSWSHTTLGPEDVVIQYRTGLVADGAFLFEGVPVEGSYSVEVSAWSSDRKYSIHGWAQFQLEDGTTPGLRVTLTKTELQPQR